ncbi:MAG: RHS repeat-associated core domain-containing protein [Nanoarchaeota archaeon]
MQTQTTQKQNNELIWTPISSNENLYNDIGNGTTYVSSSFCTQNSSTDLTANADLHVQDKLANNLFALGIKWTSESLPGTLTQIYASESSFDPILIVTYNTDLTYDNAGNLIKGLGKYYEYDPFNQLSRVRNKNASGNIIAEYKYDHEGNRIKQIEYNFAGNGHNRTTYYISDNFIQIRYTNGTILNETYYYANGKLVAKKDNSGTKTFYHSDHLGSTSLVTNQSGHVIEENHYLPHGDIYAGEEDSRFLFAGKERDKLVDLDYLINRYYSPFLRLLIQPDKTIPNIYNPQYLNRYSYVLNNPYKYVDPNGLWAIQAGLGGLAGAGAAVTGEFGIAVVISDSGHIDLGVYGTGGTGALFGGASAGTSVVGTFSPRAQSLKDLEGQSISFEASGNIPLLATTGGAGVSFDLSDKGTIVGQKPSSYSVSVGIGEQTSPIQGTVMRSNTQTINAVDTVKQRINDQINRISNIFTNPNNQNNNVGGTRFNQNSRGITSQNQNNDKSKQNNLLNKFINKIKETKR